MLMIAVKNMPAVSKSRRIEEVSPVWQSRKSATIFSRTLKNSLNIDFNARKRLVSSRRTGSVMRILNRVFHTLFKV